MGQQFGVLGFRKPLPHRPRSLPLARMMSELTSPTRLRDSRTVSSLGYANWQKNYWSFPGATVTRREVSGEWSPLGGGESLVQVAIAEHRRIYGSPPALRLASEITDHGVLAAHDPGLEVISFGPPTIGPAVSEARKRELAASTLVVYSRCIGPA